MQHWIICELHNEKKEEEKKSVVENLEKKKVEQFICEKQLKR